MRIVLLSGVQKFVENTEEGLARMALEPPGLAPDLGDLLPGDEILKTDADLSSLAEPATEDIIRPDQLFLLIHQGGSSPHTPYRPKRPRTGHPDSAGASSPARSRSVSRRR